MFSVGTIASAQEPSLGSSVATLTAYSTGIGPSLRATIEEAFPNPLQHRRPLPTCALRTPRIFYLRRSAALSSQRIPLGGITQAAERDHNWNGNSSSRSRAAGQDAGDAVKRGVGVG